MMLLYMQNNNLIVPKFGPVADLVRFANLPNVRITNGLIIPLTVPKQGIMEGGWNVRLGLSALGTAIYSDLTLKQCKYTDFKGVAQTAPPGANAVTNIDDIYISSVIVKVTQQTTIVSTTIQGAPPGAGEVNEYIGSTGANITINGIILGQNGVYPADEVGRLISWLEAPVSKGITSWWLDMFGINNVIVMDYEVPQLEGEFSQQLFRIDCKASYPVTLRVTQPIQ